MEKKCCAPNPIPKEFMFSGVVQYNIVTHKLLCIKKICCVRIDCYKSIIYLNDF